LRAADLDLGHRKVGGQVERVVLQHAFVKRHRLVCLTCGLEHLTEPEQRRLIHRSQFQGLTIVGHGLVRPPRLSVDIGEETVSPVIVRISLQRFLQGLDCVIGAVHLVI